ncbi:unnamed protein product [Owenia fusiformis]|uniref:Uncharacterized protein n=1 Tax=Owenia fusiformis TaxID=6347 RepID=A0A8J1TVV3_OWEFU|nr:unnamed protein product [Owenia fusiformis]
MRLPRMLIAGHSFVSRIESPPVIWKCPSNLGLTNALLTFEGLSGASTESLWEKRLQHINLCNFDGAFIQVGGNQLTGRDCIGEVKEVVDKVIHLAKRIQEKVPLVYVGKLFYRGVSDAPSCRLRTDEEAEIYNRKVEMTNRLLKEKFKDLKNIHLWYTKGVQLFAQDLLQEDGTHLNRRGHKKFWRTLRGATIQVIKCTLKRDEQPSRDSPTGWNGRCNGPPKSARSSPRGDRTTATASPGRRRSTTCPSQYRATTRRWGPTKSTSSGRCRPTTNRSGRHGSAWTTNGPGRYGPAGTAKRTSGAKPRQSTNTGSSQSANGPGWYGPARSAISSDGPGRYGPARSTIPSDGPGRYGPARYRKSANGPSWYGPARSTNTSDGRPGRYGPARSTISSGWSESKYETSRHGSAGTNRGTSRSRLNGLSSISPRKAMEYGSRAKYVPRTCSSTSAGEYEQYTINARSGPTKHGRDARATSASRHGSANWREPTRRSDAPPRTNNGKYTGGHGPAYDDRSRECMGHIKKYPSIARVSGDNTRVPTPYQRESHTRQVQKPY